MIEKRNRQQEYERPAEMRLHILQPESKQSIGSVPFIVQPLLSIRDHSLHAYEVLYRGIHPTHPDGWVDVDIALLRHLARFRMSNPLFVNLSNQTILSVDEDLLFAAHARNKLVFEWSEAVTEDAKFKEIIRNINRWSQRGLQFAIDDFGAGRDGLERMFAVNHVSVVKIDGGFFQRALQDSMARNLVKCFISECAKKKILTLAEWVESPADFELAQSIGVDLVQGFYVDYLHAESTVALQT